MDAAARTILKAITDFIQKNRVRTCIAEGIEPTHPFIPVSLTLQDNIFIIFVQDEYEDLKIDNDSLRLILVLRELEMLADSSDYLDWCKIQDIDASNSAFRNYYMETIGCLEKIRKLFPKETITSFITDLDFQLNAGAIQHLRKSKLS